MCVFALRVVMTGRSFALALCEAELEDAVLVVFRRG